MLCTLSHLLAHRSPEHSLDGIKHQMTAVKYRNGEQIENGQIDADDGDEIEQDIPLKMYFEVATPPTNEEGEIIGKDKKSSTMLIYLSPRVAEDDFDDDGFNDNDEDDFDDDNFNDNDEDTADKNENDEQDSEDDRSGSGSGDDTSGEDGNGDGGDHDEEDD